MTIVVIHTNIAPNIKVVETGCIKSAIIHIQDRSTDEFREWLVDVDMVHLMTNLIEGHIYGSKGFSVVLQDVTDTQLLQLKLTWSSNTKIGS